MRNLKIQFGAGRAKGGTKNRNLHLLVLLSLLLCGQMLHAQLSVSFSLDEPSCFGLPDGNITATASGGVAPYNFTWSNGTMGAVLSGVPAGNYSVTVTDNNGAVTTQNVVLTQPTLVTATLVADQCNNPITITAVGNGGVPPYMYNWTNGEETATISVNPGTYCVTLTDMNYCGTVECITVNNVPLNVAVSTQGLTCPGANDGVLTANVTGGTPPFSYLWSTGATSQSIGNLAPGAYGVTVTDANGCSDNAIGVVSDQAPIVINTNSTNPTCTNDTNGNASASASGGTPPYTYQWSNGQSGSFITNLGPGTYTVTVTDANGCIMQASVSLSPVSNLVVGATATPETCVDFNNGTATAIAASGVQPYTYQWSNGATTASLNNLAPGTYTVTVTDAVFCTGFATVTVEAAPDFNISLTNTNVTTCGANNGTATVTITAGVGPFTYLWNTGSTSPQLTGLPGGVYMVTVTDGNGCQIFGQTNVIEPPAVNVELTATPLVCQGDDNGSVNISLTGGTPPFQYNWSNGASTPFLMNVGAGTYSLTVVDAFGCSDVDQVTINEAPAVNVSVAGTTIVCGSGNLGSATALVSGGTAPFQYQWSNGATTSSVNNLPEGTFSVSVIDANGCMAVGMITINIIDDLSVEVSAQDVDCFGDTDGSATATVSGGDQPYTYMWSNGGTGASINNVAAGTYTVTVTEANGCTVSTSVTINQPNDLNATINSSDFVCFGESTGTASTVVNGGTPPYTYQWSNGIQGSAQINLPEGTYTVTVTDANDCTATAETTISSAPEVTVSVSGTNVVCGSGNTGSATANATSGVAPFSYSWSNGESTPTINNLAEGTYTVTVTDANGCTATGSIMINISTDILTTFTVVEPPCFGDLLGSATVNPVGGSPPYSFEWSNGATTASINNVAAGTYTVTVTDTNECDVAASVTINQPTLLQVSINSSGLTCFGEALGTATAIPAGGTPPYSYEWSNGDMTPTISDVAAGTYTVTVTDDNDCEATATIEIMDLPELNLVINAPEIVCGEENSGEASVIANGGTPPYDYEWNTGQQTESIEELPSGTYTVTVTDANGCTSTTEATIEVISDLAVNLIPRDVLCFGDSNGGVLAEASGGDAPYTFEWSTGSMNNELVDVAIGTYSVTVTDANGCTISASADVNQPNELDAQINGTDALCEGESSGMASVSVTGGTAPYTYEWSNGLQGSTQINLFAGTYTVTITDANDCTTTAEVAIDEPSALTVNVNTPLINCGGTETGSATAIVNGGTPPYTYEWSNGGSTDEINNLPAGTYDVTVTDANGCSILGQTFTVQELPMLTLNFEVTNIVCSNDPEGIVEVLPEGGTPPYSFEWNNGATTSLLENLTAGAYEVTVLDANECETTGAVVVTQVAALEVDPVFANVSCIGGDDGSITINVTGGTEPYTYDWSTGDETQTISGLTAGSYSVTVTGSSGCVGIASVNILEPTAIALTTSSTPASCFDFSDGSASVSVTGGTPPYTIEWSNGATGGNIVGLAAGTYDVTVTDANECTEVSSVTVTDPNPVEVTATVEANTCEGDNQGSATAVAAGGTPPYTFEWSNGQGTATATGLAGGNYFVTATDANECTAVTSVNITALPNPTCEINLISEVVFGGDGELEVVPSGGNPPYTFEWSDGQTTAIATGLNGGDYMATVTDANGCTTTCEFTLVPLSGLGDFVWEDINHNGIQDPNEPGYEGMKVKLKDEFGNVIDSTFTDSDGFYQFIGLQPGTYSVMFTLPSGYQYTETNAGMDDTVDSDVDLTTNEMTMNVTLAPGEFNFTLDAGIELIPTNEIVDPCTCLNNSTSDNNGQFSEAIRLFSYPNETWTIIDQEGMFLASSPAPPADPIPVPVGTQLVEVSPGEYEYEFIIIDAITYVAFSITNGFDTLMIENTCFYPDVNMDEVPQGEYCITDDPIELSATPSIPGTLTFFVDGMEVNSIDPAVLGIGTFEFEAEFVPDNPDECITNIISSFTIIDDCTAFVGDFVWIDANQDGIQDPNEPGIPNVMVIINGVDESSMYVDTTFTDSDGLYLFEVPAGTYKITFMQPNGFLPSPQNVGGDDAIDSDADPVMGMTEIFTIESNETDLTWDAGFYSKCDNLDNPGTISGYQFLCGPGNDPDPIVSVTDPSGGSGEIEYLWMYSTVPGPFDPAIWVPIPNSNTASFDPGPLFETTYFARCARRECCTTYLESNIIVIEVGDVAVANINGPSLVCSGEENNFFAAGNGPGAVVEWNFGPNATPQTATGSPVGVTFNSFGTYTIELQVTEDGCTSIDYKEITVSNSPAVCMSGLVIDVEVLNSNSDIRVEWQLEDQDETMIYTVEHSIDGINFEAVGLVVNETEQIDHINYYQFIHEDPKQGRNYYRVKVTDNDGLQAHSQIAEAIIYGDSRLMMIYPNPVQDQMVIELFETYEDDVNIRLISMDGRVLQQLSVDSATKRIPLGMTNYPSGTYLVQVRYGKLDVKTFKVVKQ